MTHFNLKQRVLRLHHIGTKINYNRILTQYIVVVKLIILYIGVLALAFALAVGLAINLSVKIGILRKRTPRAKSLNRSYRQSKIIRRFKYKLAISVSMVIRVSEFSPEELPGLPSPRYWISSEADKRYSRLAFRTFRSP